MLFLSIHPGIFSLGFAVLLVPAVILFPITAWRVY